jgi:hypothetical protein
MEDLEISEMLAVSGAGRDDERRLFTAELMRRMNDARQRRNEAELPSDSATQRYREASRVAAERVHAVERRVEARNPKNAPSGEEREAHKASLLAEENRSQVETAAEVRAEHHREVDKLRRHLGRE